MPSKERSRRYRVRCYHGDHRWVAISRNEPARRLAYLIEHEGIDEIMIGGIWRDLNDEGAAVHAEVMIQRGVK